MYKTHLVPPRPPTQPQLLIAQGNDAADVLWSTTDPSDVCLACGVTLHSSPIPYTVSICSSLISSVQLISFTLVHFVSHRSEPFPVLAMIWLLYFHNEEVFQISLCFGLCKTQFQTHSFKVSSIDLSRLGLFSKHLFPISFIKWFLFIQWHLNGEDEAALTGFLLSYPESQLDYSI